MSHVTRVAALYVQRGGIYYGLDDVDPWDEERDARTYAGPWPVVAHPPCARWCQLAGLVEARYGYKRGEDCGMFAAALEAVRLWGGVLEHPAYSTAWPAHGLPAPHREGWQRTICGGWVCHVEQGHYGHRARKATWLYAHGINEPPPMMWGKSKVRGVSWCRLSKRERAATPTAFRDVLLDIARSVRAKEEK
jgi:hypothetical protein